MALRPTSWQPPAAIPQTPPARTAAQRAFFDAAMGRAAPVQAPPTPAGAPTPSAPRTVQVDTGGEPPRKILRPGSLLDIRV